MLGTCSAHSKLGGTVLVPGTSTVPARIVPHAAILVPFVSVLHFHSVLLFQFRLGTSDWYCLLRTLFSGSTVHELLVLLV
jgi:hypothetical protein